MPQDIPGVPAAVQRQLVQQRRPDAGQDHDGARTHLPSPPHPEARPWALRGNGFRSSIQIEKYR